MVVAWAKLQHGPGVGMGTVLLCTKHVMVAILRKKFWDVALCMPTEEEKIAAKRWVRK